MIPILYHSGESKFQNNGLGALSDAMSCTVTEELNGTYELQMKYPVTGVHFSDIAMKSIILAKPNTEDEPQPFVVYRITKPMKGTVSIYAEHISYYLSGIPLKSLSLGSNDDEEYVSIQEVLTAITENSFYVDNPFTFDSDITTTKAIEFDYPISVREAIFDESNGVLPTFGGEFYANSYSIKICKQRGSNKGFSICYGKNMTDFTQEENWESLYTGIFPYYKDDMGLITLETDLNADKYQLETAGGIRWLAGKRGFNIKDGVLIPKGSFNFKRVKIVDLTSEFEDGYPTEDELLKEAISYIDDNGIGTPETSITVSFVKLSDTKEYEGINMLENLSLGDSVTVKYPEFDVEVTPRCVQTCFDCLNEKYSSITLGTVKKSLENSIIKSEKTVKKVTSSINNMKSKYFEF